MIRERDLGNDFKYVLEVDRTLLPEPEVEQVLWLSEEYLVWRPATPAEQISLQDFADFIRNPKRGSVFDSDILRSQAAGLDPLVIYLEWLADERADIDERRREQIAEMAIDRRDYIMSNERAPLNLMGNQVHLDRNYRERMDLFKYLPPFLQKLDFLQRIRYRKN